MKYRNINFQLTEKAASEISVSANLPISVVIPTYNGIFYIAKTLESICSQKVLPAEIVIVDDASNDGTHEFLYNFAKNSLVPTNIIRLPINTGTPVYPLNVGVSAATNKIIATLDQDDLMAPDRLFFQYSLLEKKPECPLVFGLYTLIDNEGYGSGEPRISSEWILQIPHIQVGMSGYLLDRTRCYINLVTEKNFVHGASNIAFRKEVWSKLGGFNDTFSIAWDLDFAIRSCTLGDLGFINKIIQSHRVHSRNLSKNVLQERREVAALRSKHLLEPLFDVDLSPYRFEIAELWSFLSYMEAHAGNLKKSIKCLIHSVKLGYSPLSAAYEMVKIPIRVLFTLSRKIKNLG